METKQPSDEFKEAFRIIFVELMRNGHNFMEAGIFADGRLFKVKVVVKEIIEGEEDQNIHSSGQNPSR